MPTAVQRRRLTALRAPCRKRAGHRPWLSECANTLSATAALDCDSPPPPHAQSVFSAHSRIGPVPTSVFRQRHRTKARANAGMVG